MNYADLPTWADLPTKVRREAKKMAKDLLRTVPAAETTEQDYDACTLRGALSTMYMRPENVIAVLIYTDRAGNWWGDIILKTGKDSHIQVGTSAAEPVSSAEEALEGVKSQIASIKSKPPEHPFVKEMREAGFDPERISLLRVRHPKFGTRWMVLDVEVQRVCCDHFKKYCEAAKIDWNYDDVINFAKLIVFQTVPHFIDEKSNFVAMAPPPENSDDQFHHHILSCAGAALLASGIINIEFDPSDLINSAVSQTLH